MRKALLLLSSLFLVLPLLARETGASSLKETKKEEGSSFKIPMYTSLPKNFKAEGTPPLIFQAIILSAFVLLPFFMMLLTPFAKMVMVFSLLRNALGVQQVPPNQVINGISLLLSVFVMFPVGLDMYKQGVLWMRKNPAPTMDSPAFGGFIVQLAQEVKEPLRKFLKLNSNKTHIRHFFRVAFKTVPEEFRESINMEGFMILIPSYITTQVKNGFETGTLIFLPFFVIDMVVSNILLAMGMMMLSPVTISLPIKIFLLVMIDGWTLITKGLIDSYRLS
ncbi:type III secretion system export apparatus subunit SctR [Candidatus Similichlamydia laticola]|uniref:Type III secretion inner membrane protein (YscR) n=1 Tax=Candidatus Similichlamydia laticola TaxID=2170265 RepID=A0A369KLF3_9BACT|nr:type III secretion system export apparatus subunit SctR [Candidatus Similichlamydia laticola]RDB31846.1 Type III secretion inner membrane protein (YscR) [Candidatus Similichlamydia laticola]